jgi:hypothetical protein
MELGKAGFKNITKCVSKKERNENEGYVNVLSSEMCIIGNPKRHALVISLSR